MKRAYRLFALVTVLSLSFWLGSYELAHALPPRSCPHLLSCDPNNPPYVIYCGSPGSPQWTCTCEKSDTIYRWYCRV